MDIICKNHLRKAGEKLDRVSLLFSDVYPTPKCFDEDDKRVYIFGSPIYKEKINSESLIRDLLIRHINDFVREINGSFLCLIYDKRKKELSIANDRFASIPFYYRVDNGIFTGATNYSDIWRQYRNRDSFKINEEAFYEFLSMKRLFGNKTYDHDTNFLDSASIITFQPDSGRLITTRYWQPDCKRNNLTPDETVERIASLVRQSFKRATSDSRRYGLLLSGGLDSRAVLSASDNPLLCYTTCGYRNNEYLVANELSHIKNYEHVFIDKPRTYYSDIIDRAVYISGAMNVYISAQFFNIEEVVKKRSDLLLHGYGFDFLLRGKYLPLTTLHPSLKHITHRRRLKPLDSTASDMPKEFIENISYRLKSVKPAALLKDGVREKIEDSLYENMRNIFNSAKRLSDDPYLWWTYCNFHNVSRHYTWLNLSSIRSFIEERTIAFDNDLFDLFWSMDAKAKLNGDIFLRAMRFMDPALLKVRYANTNLGFDDHPVATAFKMMFKKNKILRRTGLNTIFKNVLPAPLREERSWALDRKYINMLTSDLCLADSLEELRFLNMDAVRRCMKEHLEGKKNHESLILRLTTLNKFLKMGR